MSAKNLLIFFVLGVAAQLAAMWLWSKIKP